MALEQASTTAREATRTRVEHGIRKDSSGYEVYVKVGVQQVAKRFKKNTAIHHMRQWREHMRQTLKLNRILPPVKAKELPRAPIGWCYIYFIRSENFVKIGKTRNPAGRFVTLQSAHHCELFLIAAVPAHRSIETALHQRFAHLRQNGEWFRMADELVEFIDLVKTGVNPFALLWDQFKLRQITDFQRSPYEYAPEANESPISDVRTT